MWKSWHFPFWQWQNKDAGLRADLSLIWTAWKSRAKVESAQCQTRQVQVPSKHPMHNTQGKAGPAYSIITMRLACLLYGTSSTCISVQLLTDSHALPVYTAKKMQLPWTHLCALVVGEDALSRKRLRVFLMHVHICATGRCSVHTHSRLRMCKVAPKPYCRKWSTGSWGSRPYKRKYGVKPVVTCVVEL